jgi:hypothetical protein
MVSIIVSLEVWAWASQKSELAIIQKATELVQGFVPRLWVNNPKLTACPDRNKNTLRVILQSLTIAPLEWHRSKICRTAALALP